MLRTWFLREIAGQDIDMVGEILPRAGDALHLGLRTELTLRPHFAGDARVTSEAEASEVLVHHRVDGVLEL